MPSGVIKHGCWKMYHRIEIGDFPDKASIPRGFLIAMLDYQRVAIHCNEWEFDNSSKLGVFFFMAQLDQMIFFIDLHSISLMGTGIQS